MNTSEESSRQEKSEPLKKPVFEEKEKVKKPRGVKLDKEISESIKVVTPVLNTVIAFTGSERLTEEEKEGFNTSLFMVCRKYGVSFLPEITLFLWSLEIITSRIIDKVIKKQMIKGKQEQDTKAEFEHKVKQAKSEGVTIETETEKLNRTRTMDSSS